MRSHQITTDQSNGKEVAPRFCQRGMAGAVVLAARVGDFNCFGGERQLLERSAARVRAVAAGGCRGIHLPVARCSLTPTAAVVALA